MNNDKQKIYDELSKSFLEENEKSLHRKNSKKNRLTKEGLMNACQKALDDLFEYEPEWQSFSNAKFEKKLRWYMKRSVFYYLNKGLTYKVANSFNNLGLPYEERLSAATTGFLLALESFDENQGTQFSTYSWRVMSNEIIAANKHRSRSRVVKQKPRQIRANEDGFIYDIKPSNNARKVMFRAKPVVLQDVYVYPNDGSSERVYEYLYNFEDNIKVGNQIKKGDIIGKTAGVETEVASTESITTSEESDGIVFINPLTSKSEEDERADNAIDSSSTAEQLMEAVASLSKMEQLVISKRFLTEKRVKRTDLSKELQLSVAELTKIEKEALKKLRTSLEKDDIDSTYKLTF